MTDIGELTRLVDEDPRDNEQRWHLAKKLYMAGEYRTALGHLLILRTNWTPKVNVLRYLAADYYRLGRYDEAALELRTGIEEWPDEISLREQLARNLEVSGRLQEAIAVWQEILKANPNHTLARKTVARLTSKDSAAPEKHSIAGGVGLPGEPFGRLCPNCGAQNSEEFDRCWKCYTALTGNLDAQLLTTPHPKKAVPPAESDQWFWIGLIVSIGLILIGGYLTGRQALYVWEHPDAADAVRIVQQIFEISLLSTHIVLGLVLLIAWPAAVWVACHLAKADSVPFKTAAVTGLFCGALAYLLTWCPVAVLPFVLVLPLLASGVPMMTLYKIGVGRALLTWAIQAVLAGGAILAALTALEGGAMLWQFPAIASYAGMHDNQQNAGTFQFPVLLAPIDKTIRWESTGSPWLDERGSSAQIEIRNETSDPSLSVELKDESGTVDGGYVRVAPFSFTCKVAPGHPYKLLITGKPDTKVECAIYGVMKVQADDGAKPVKAPS